MTDFVNDEGGKVEGPPNKKVKKEQPALSADARPIFVLRWLANSSARLAH